MKVANFILDVRENMSGVEMAAALRSRTICDILGHETYYFTTVYNKYLANNVDTFKNADRFSLNTKIINIYDYYQLTDKISDGLKVADLNFRTIKIEGTNDFRGYDEKGNFIAFLSMDQNEPTKINFINYIKEGKPFRRDQYNAFGTLSRTELLDSPNDNTEIYYNTNANPVLVKKYSIEEGTQKIKNIQLNDESGNFIKCFEKEIDFHKNWMDEVIEKYQIDVALVDRVLEFYQPLRELKESKFVNLKVIPVVHSSHTKGDTMASELTQFYVQPLQEMQKQDGIIVLTNRQEQDILKRFGEACIFVLPHAHNIRLKKTIQLKPKIKKNAPKRIVQVARYSPEKRHLKAIDIYEKVIKKFPNIRIDFYGFGASEKEIIKKIDEKNLGKNIKVNGFKDDVNDIFLNADLSVITSSVEGYCLAIQESLANGCPVVAFDVKYGPAEMIKNGENGYLIPEGRDMEMVEKIVALLESDDILEAMGSKAISLSERFTEDNLAKDWKKMFASLDRDLK